MANKALTQEQLQEAVDAYYLNEKDATAASKALGMARMTFKNRLARACQAKIKPSTHAANASDPILKHEQTIRNLQDDKRDLVAQLNTIQRENITAGKIREFISGVQEALPEPPNWVIDPGVVGEAGTPVTVWSDWHVGEVVSKEQVGGINEFNLKIAQKRVRTLVEKIILLSFKHTVNPSYPGIVICLGGDLISGRIHQELVEGQEGAFTAQLMETFSLLAWAIEQMADRFEHVFLPCVVGNHGRMHDKPRAKNRAQDSFEYLIYHFLDTRFRDDKRIHFFIPEQTDARFNVGNHRFLLTHGDSMGARGGDGIIGSAGPMIRGEKKVREVASFSGDDYDTALIGHYHQFFQNSVLIANSALKGYDEFARNVLRCRPELPSQTLFFVHPEFGIIDTRRIWLEKKPKQSKSGWVSWPEAS